jgi:phosphate-selective porin OprO/OprP
MLDLMLKKGVITQKDYDEFMEANKEADENKAFKDSRIDKDVSKSMTFILKRAPDGAVKPSGFGFVSGDGKSEINLTGRMHMDGRIFDSPFSSASPNDPDARNYGNQFDIRRARIGVTGKFLNDFNFEMVWNAVSAAENASTTSSNLDTAWINYSARRDAQVRVGRYKQPFSLEDYSTSSNNIDFIERSYVNNLMPGKKPGIMLHGIPSDGTAYAISVFQDSHNQASGSGNLQVAGRYATDLGKMAKWTDKFLHVGVAGTSGKYDSAVSGTAAPFYSDLFPTIRSEHRGVNAFTSRMDISATTLLSTVSKTTIGGEVAYGDGPLKLQAEYAAANYSGRDNNQGRAEMSGNLLVGYVSAVYNLTGENWYDSYKDGAFSSIKIKNNFDPSGSGMGAWQVGLRLSMYDASDIQQLVSGCTAANCLRGSDRGTTTTLGLTWFINPNARMMLNYSMTKFEDQLAGSYLSVGSGNLGNTEKVATLRAQYNF